MKRVINFLSSKKGGLLMVLLVAAAIPLTVATSQKQQNTQQEALVTLRRAPCKTPSLLGMGSKGYGDVNRDGRVNSLDANLILQYSAGSIKLTSLQIEVADVDGPSGILSSAGNVNPIDSNLISQYGINLIKTFPVCKSLYPTPTPTRRPAGPTPTRRPISPTPIPPVKTYITPTLTPSGAYSITLNVPTRSCSETNSIVHLTWSTSGFSANWFDVFSIGGDHPFAVDNNSAGNSWSSGALINGKTYTFRVQNHDWDLTGGTPVQSNSRSITTLDCLNP